MSDDLVEKVIDAMSNCGSETVGSRMARAAIAVLRPALRAEALEEAAKVAEAFPARTHGNLASAPYAAAEQAGDEIAAAIRKLKADT